MLMLAHTGRFLAVALIGLCLAACAGKEEKTATPGDPVSEEMQREIMDIVDDKDRAEQAVELSNQLRGLLADGVAHVERAIDELHALNLDYDTTEAELRAFFAKFDADTLARQKQALEIDGRMKSLLTAEEWAELTKARKNLMESYFGRI